MGHHPLPGQVCPAAKTSAASSPGAEGGGLALQQGQPQSLFAWRPHGPMCSPATTGCATTCKEFGMKWWEPLLCRLKMFLPWQKEEKFFHHPCSCEHHMPREIGPGVSHDALELGLGLGQRGSFSHRRSSPPSCRD